MKLKALLLAILLSTFMPMPSAFAVAATDVFAYEAYAFRSIVATDDLFIVMRYELPISTVDTTTDAWCLELNDSTGCDADPAAPTDPTSLVRGVASATIYENGYGTAAPTEQVTLNRIGHALAGIYIDAGNPITDPDTGTWGTSGVTEVCIESSTTLYTSPTHECTFPVWSAAANTQIDQRDSLAVLMAGPSGPMVNLESARLEPDNTYINGINLITPTGSVFALEAFSFMDRIIPSAFQLGASDSVVTAIATPSSESAIQQSIDATAVASGITQDIENVAQQYIGTSGPTLAIAGIFLGSVVLGGMMWSFTKSQPLAILGFLSPLTWGMWLRAPTFAVIATMIVVFATLGTWYFIRKAPA